MEGTARDFLMNFFKALLLVLWLGLFLFFIILLGSFFVSAWSIEGFCFSQANGSISDYTSCTGYFMSLNNSGVNNFTIINNTVNNTFNNSFVVYVNNSFDYSKFVTSSDLDNALRFYYMESEVDSKFSDFQSREDLKLENLRITLMSSFKDELKTKGWLEQVVTYKPNISTDEFVKKEDIRQLETDLEGLKDNLMTSSKSNINYSYILIGIGVLVVGYYFFVYKKKNSLYDVPGGSQNNQVVDEEKIKLKMLLEQQNKIIKEQGEVIKSEGDKVGELIKKINEMKN